MVFPYLCEDVLVRSVTNPTCVYLIREWVRTAAHPKRRGEEKLGGGHQLVEDSMKLLRRIS